MFFTEIATLPSKKLKVMAQIGTSRTSNFQVPLFGKVDVQSYENNKNYIHTVCLSY